MKQKPGKRTVIWTIANQKGGVGKTTTTVTLGSGLAREGRKVLVVDLDSQGHVSRMLAQPKQPGVRRWYYDEEPLEQAIVQARENLWILPGDKSTDKVMARIRDESYGEEQFANQLKEHAAALGFDVVIVDLAPSLNNLQVAALIAANYVLIPTRLRFTDMDGVQEVLKTLQQIGRHGHQVSGYFLLPTLFDRGANETIERLKELVASQGARVWPPIVQDVRVGEAPGRGLTIWEYAPTCNAVLGYVNGGKRVGGYTDTLQRVLALLEGV
jgi:chromosome partitioning protein